MHSAGKGGKKKKKKGTAVANSFLQIHLASGFWLLPNVYFEGPNITQTIIAMRQWI
jgi:hypothetical protein